MYLIIYLPITYTRRQQGCALRCVVGLFSFFPAATNANK